MILMTLLILVEVGKDMGLSGEPLQAFIMRRRKRSFTVEKNVDRRQTKTQSRSSIHIEWYSRIHRGRVG